MAANFNGSTAEIGVGSFSNLTGVNAGSVAFWMNPTDLSGTDRLYGINTQFECRTSGTTLFNDLCTSGPNEGSTTISTATWIHVVQTYSNNGTGGSANTQTMYVNGALVSSGSASTTTVMATGTLTIANRTGSSATEHYNGRLDDIRIYNRVLSADEAMELFVARGRDNLIRGLLNRWMMAEGGPGNNVSGSGLVRDKVGTNHGTGAGTTLPTYQEARACARRRRSRR